jgi:hypothetical protein
MSVRAAVLHDQVGLPLHWQRPHLPQVGGKIERTRGNRFFKLKRLFNKLDRSNQHVL